MQYQRGSVKCGYIASLTTRCPHTMMYMAQGHAIARVAPLTTIHQFDYVVYISGYRYPAGRLAIHTQRVAAEVCTPVALPSCVVSSLIR